ncbi:Disease resistance protein RPS4B [Glycine soja]
MDALVEIFMCESKLKKLWDGVQNVIQNLANLKQIDLCGSRDLIEMPGQKLEKVDLGYCESLHHLHVPSKSLHLLELNHCSSLKEFSMASKEMTDLNLSHMSLRELDLRGTSIESLPENIQNLSMLKTLWLDDCRKLVSLPKLPPYLEQLRAFICTLLEIDTTQWLVLQHMLQSSIPSYMHKQRVYSDGGYFILAGDHGPVLNACVSCSIYQGGKHVGWNGKSIVHCANLIPDHVLFLYHDVCKVYRESIVHSSSDIPFNFEFDYYDVKVGRDQEKIKGCGVFPVYFSTSGLKLVSSSSSSKELEPQIMKMNRTSSL